MLLGREVHKKSAHEPQGCQLGFGSQTFQSIDRSLTLYFGCISALHGDGVYSSKTVGFIYSPACSQTCLEHFLVSMTLVVCQVAG